MKKIFTTAILVFIISGVFAQAPNPYPKTISVNGSADIEITPDEIYVLVTLKEYDKKGTGKIGLEKIKTDFLNACTSVGLADSVITIASYEGNPLKKKRSKVELYASISYQVKFNNSKKMDELVNKLDDEATQSFDVVRVSHSKIQEYRKQMRIQAIKAAKEKAAYLTEAVGESLGTAVTITESSQPFVQPQYFNISQTAHYALKPRLNSDESSDSGVDFKKIKVFMEVNVVFAIK